MHLLVDGDIVTYQSASSSELKVDWDNDGHPTPIANKEEAFLQIDQKISSYCKRLKCQNVLILFSDDKNWRHEIFPEYKANRKKNVRPVHLKECRKYVQKKYDTQLWPNLEADDVMGILATRHSGKTILVSIDKDMLTIPGKLYNPMHPERGIIEVTAHNAVFNHMQQALKGDPTDGYYGIRGVGDRRATKILYDGLENKFGLSLNEYRSVLWEAVLEAYLSKGMTEDEALLNTRLAHILTKKYYKNKTVKLWEPPKKVKA